MEERLLHRSYREWPAESEKREELARELFGEHVVAAYDSWLNIAAKMLYAGYRYKSPTEEEKRFLNWIASLPNEDRHEAFAFVRDIVHGTIFSILNHLDGTSGAVLQGAVREEFRVVMEIYSRDEDTQEAQTEPVEVIPINTQQSRERGNELHELWYSWRNKYSRRHEDQ